MGPARARIARELEAARDDMVRFAADLVAIPSTNPPGERYAECAARIGAELDRLGIARESVEAPRSRGEGRVSLLGSVGSGPRCVIFHGHYDVVPAQRESQFTPRLEGGRLHGRGAADMKAGVAAMVHAAAALGRAGVRLAGRVGLCLVPDEETGGRGGSAHLDEIGVLGRDGVAMLTMEPTGGAVWNASRGALTLEVTVRGRPAHVGLQHQGVNAFERMLEVARRLQALKAEVEARATRHRVEPPEAARSILMLGGRVEGGSGFNVVPDRCSFTVERRTNPEEDGAAESARVLDLLQACRRDGIDLDVEVLQQGDASATDEGHPVAEALAEAVREVTGARPSFTMCPGLLETRWYASRGVPALAFGPGSLDCAHGPDESVDLRLVERHALVYALAAVRLLA